jgi:coproporphyrinogen III oxidase
VSWSYQRSDAADSAEAELTQRFLVRRDWLTGEAGATA